MKAIHAEPNLIISLCDKHRWIYVNDRKFGFIKDGGLYCHRRQVEQYGKEKGFHIPRVLLNYVVTWEIHIKEDVYSTWTYDPKNKQRMLPTLPMIFLSCARLVWKSGAEHVKRPR